MVLAERLVSEILCAVVKALVDWLAPYAQLLAKDVPYRTVEVASLSVVKVMVAELESVDVAMAETIGAVSTVVFTL